VLLEENEISCYFKKIKSRVTLIMLKTNWINITTFCWYKWMTQEKWIVYYHSKSWDPKQKTKKKSNLAHLCNTLNHNLKIWNVLWKIHLNIFYHMTFGLYLNKSINYNCSINWVRILTLKALALPIFDTVIVLIKLSLCIY
jgi:hypothetical protein